jgi:hypothetical protein
MLHGIPFVNARFECWHFLCVLAKTMHNDTIANQSTKALAACCKGVRSSLLLHWLEWLSCANADGKVR